MTGVHHSASSGNKESIPSPAPCRTASLDSEHQGNDSSERHQAAVSTAKALPQPPGFVEEKQELLVLPSLLGICVQ